MDILRYFKELGIPNFQKFYKFQGIVNLEIIGVSGYYGGFSRDPRIPSDFKCFKDFGRVLGSEAWKILGT